jgi:hypothetical protein
VAVGVSEEGPGSGFVADGTSSVHILRRQGFPESKKALYAYYQSYFDGDETKTTCLGHTSCTVTLQKWAGGDNIYHRKNAPKAPHCVNELSGSTWTETDTTATTIGAGWNVYSFRGSAQTGYATTAAIHFAYARRGILCGVYDQPGGSPGILVGK